METEKESVSSSKDKEIGEPKVIAWEDLEQELARLWSLSSALKKAKEKKQALVQKLEPLIKQVNAESACRSNELQDMLQRLESRKWAMGNSLLHLKMTKEELQRHEEQLPSAVRSLLLASKQCSLASRQLDEAEKLLAGERGYGHLQHLQKLLRIRQQYMVTQVSSIYPVKCLVGKTSEEKINSDHRGNTSEEDSVSSSSHVSKPNNNNNNNTEAASSLTILGLPLPTPTLRKPSFFSDKKEAQRSATSLGYVAHAVSLIASYLDVPLRYPVHLGGSRSYIHDNAPSVDPVSSDLSLSSSEVVVSPKPVEFPLFLEGQDTTRAAYAIFLLNKDLEQLLNHIGVESRGPRHVLANLKELISRILSHGFTDEDPQETIA
ncbi:hypothetical protein AMTRI_Chr01g104310 [Amborella trichopoda]